jgi:hypothetical protein
MPDLQQPETLITLAALVLGLIVVAATILIERRPRDLMKPRIIPTTPVMFLGMLVAILALVHLVNLAGLHTGRG